MTIEGKIKLIGETQNFGSNGFVKRELVVTTEEQYPQDILIEFVKDKVDLLDKYQLGETVKVSVNLRGREWTNPQGEVKYFNSIQGWRIEAAAPQQSSIPPVSPSEAFETTSDLNAPKDDLPF